MRWGRGRRGRAGDELREIQAHRLLAEAHEARCVTHPGFPALGRPPRSPSRTEAARHNLLRDCTCLEIYERLY